MTKIFAAAVVAMVVTAPTANAASMVDYALKLQSVKQSMSKMPKAVQAMIIAKARAEARAKAVAQAQGHAQACPPRFIRGNDGKCHPLFH